MTRELIDLAHELWAMAQGNPIEEAVAVMETRLQEHYAHISEPLTDKEKMGLLWQAGLVTGANLMGQLGPRYRSKGTPTNVWARDLYVLIDLARAHGIGETK